MKQAQLNPNPNSKYLMIAQQTKKMFHDSYFKKFKKQIDNLPTIICSISLFFKNEDSHKIASVGFGTKSLPYEIAKQNKGKVIKDMHAQILARKGFIQFIIKHLPKQMQQNQIFAWDGKKKKHKIRQGIQIVMYVSEIFCGDCMVHQSNNLFSGARPLKYFNCTYIPKEKYTENCLRTKPGRLDLPVNKRTLSLSCSDKVAVWNILGIQGKKLFNYLVPIYINKIVVQTNHKTTSSKIAQGIDIEFRIHKLFGFSKANIENKLFKILIQGKMRWISTQFRINKPQIILISSVQQKPIIVERQKQQLQQRRLDLCGIIAQQEISWLSGRTGLPQGVSLKKISKVSPFCSSQMYQQLKSRQEQQFKYHAVKGRIKLLFGTWTDDYKK